MVGVADDGRALVVLDPASPSRSPTSRLSLDAKLARGTLECQQRCAFVFVDERARLLAVTLDAAQFDAPIVLAQGVDRRFSPALGRPARKLLVAYTASVDKAMHTFIVPAEGGAPRDLTPEGHGAAAPTFILGEGPPTLVMIDARAGFSPLLEVPFDERGTPLEVRIGTPVSQPSAPPLIAAVQVGSEVEVLYRAIGAAAKTAFRRVWLRDARPAVPLFPTKGYGELELAVARAGQVVVAAVEEPASGSSGGVIAARLDGADPLSPFGIGRSDPPAARPSIAASPSVGSFLATFVQERTLYAAAIDCRK